MISNIVNIMLRYKKSFRVEFDSFTVENPNAFQTSSELLKILSSRIVIAHA